MYGVDPLPLPTDGGIITGDSAPIDRDVVCRKCGYNLRGLLAEGRCPECGTSAGFSLQGDFLRYCDPDWVEKLRWGTQLFMLGVLAIIGGAVASNAFLLRAGGAGVFIVIGGRILTTVALWFLTQPDPSGLGEDQYGTARKIIRVSLIAGIIQQALSRLSWVVTLDPTSSLLVGIALFVLGFMDVIGLFAQFSYLKKLALRIPEQQLSARANFLMYALGISYGLITILGPFRMLFFRFGIIRYRSTGFECFGGIGALAVFIFGISYLLLMNRLGRSFKEQSQIARASWASADSIHVAPPK